MPHRQLVMTVKTPIARVSGSQPPSAIFKRLAAKKAPSTIRKPAATAIATTSGHFQILRMASKSRQVVSSMVVETAVP
jgi:hypothetical protein